MDAKDLLGVSEPAKKLIEAIAAGIGVLYEPTRMRRHAKAQADAQLILAHADIEKDELVRRAAQRLGYQETLRQRNIDAIAIEAFQHLPDTVSDAPVQSDWLSYFFGASQDVSDVQMQQLWGALLAGEVNQPGSFSRRTLSTLQQMGPIEASYLQTALQLSWTLRRVRFLLRPSNFNRMYGPHGLYWRMAEHLASFGLLDLGSGTVLELALSTDIAYHGRRHRLRPYYLLGSVHLSVISFSSVAEEMAAVIPLTPDDNFYKRSRSLLRLRGSEVVKSNETVGIGNL